MTAVGAAPAGSRGVDADTVMDGYFTGRRYLSQTYVRFKFLSSNHKMGKMEREQRGRGGGGGVGEGFMGVIMKSQWPGC